MRGERNVLAEAARASSIGSRPVSATGRAIVLMAQPL
jgi:hypothetical protein